MPEIGPAPGTCRGHRENSNAPIVRALVRSGFIAAIGPATVEIFSAKILRKPADAPVCPLPRRKPKRPLETSAVGGPYLGVDDARRPLAVERIEDLLGGNLAHVRARFPGHPRSMRACQHVIELQQRMVRRRRLLGPDIETRPGNELVAQRFG